MVAKSEKFISLHNKETIKNNEQRESTDIVLIDVEKMENNTNKEVLGCQGHTISKSANSED